MGSDSIEVWAPAVALVEVSVGDRRWPLERSGDGFHRGRRPAEQDYALYLDGAGPVPDPRSHHQPAGVHGPTRPFDPASVEWSDQGWRGFHLPAAVLYEMHVGTFSPAGTFEGAIERLDHLVELGISAVQLMPVQAFAGERGWGYDGVLPWSVHHAYGGPAGLCRFVDACHGRGLGVILDVVHNHFGPEGNYHALFGPYLTDAVRTPWGPAVNLDGPGSPEVRDHLIGSAEWFAEHCHVDGFRLDAVHALVDGSTTHFLEELSDRIAALSAHLGRPLWLIAESDRSDPRTVIGTEAHGLGMDAQWADSLHHAVHARLTGQTDSYYADFGGTEQIAAALERVFVPDGGYSAAWGRPHGKPVGPLARWRFVGCLQNHDQVGNRARGDRIHQQANERVARVGALIVLTAPHLPMLFQGEEWAASTPFPFFCDFADEGLRTGVREGRRHEFAAFGWDPDDLLDPLDPATCELARLRWDELALAPHHQHLDLYRRLIALRRSEPDLTDARAGQTRVEYTDDILLIRRGRLAIVVNLAEQAGRVELGPIEAVEVLLATDDLSPPEVSAEGVGLSGLSGAVLRIG